MEKLIFLPVDLTVSPQLQYLPWKLDIILNQQGDRIPDQKCPMKIQQNLSRYLPKAME